MEARLSDCGELDTDLVGDGGKLLNVAGVGLLNQGLVDEML